MGESVHDADGTHPGHVRGLDEHGFYVSTAEGVVAMSMEREATAGPAPGNSTSGAGTAANSAG